MAIVSTRAFAKINLFLDITGRVKNGYHSLSSVMQSIDLADTVSVSFLPNASKNEIKVLCDKVLPIPAGKENIVSVAAKRFFAALETMKKNKTQKGIQITIQKEIPVCAGMAGGSTDAAATLKALNALYENVFSDAELLTIASGIGSDVPFCFCSKPSYVSGTGEKLESCVGISSSLSLVVAIGGEEVNTSWAYGELDKRFDFNAKNKTAGNSCRNLISSLENNNSSLEKALFYNIFEEVILPVRPFCLMIRCKMVEFGADVALMSGSGPSVFGVFGNENDARSCCENLKALGCFAVVCHAIE